MDFDSQQVLQSHLQSDEQLLWSGKPAAGIKLSTLDAFMIPFSIVWAGFSFVWEAIAIWSGAPFIFPLFGIPFVVIGYQMLIGRFFQDARNRSRTYYGITNRRAIIAYEGKTSKMKSWDLEKINIEVTQKKDGSGTISFGANKSTSTRGIPMPFTEPVLFPEFAMIDDVSRVEGIIQKAKSADRPGGSFWDEATLAESQNTEDSEMDEFERS